MTGIKHRIEILFVKGSRTLYRNPIKTLLVAFLLISAMVYPVRNIDVDTSFESLLREQDPARIAYRAFRDQFGLPEVSIIGIRSDRVFSRDFLIQLKSLHQALEAEVPYVREVHSLVNARRTRGEGDVLIVEDLLEGFPENTISMKDLQREVLANPFYRNFIISEDGRMAALIIENEAYIDAALTQAEMFDGFEENPPADSDTPAENQHRYFTDEQQSEIVDSVHQVITRYQHPDFDIIFSGSPVIGVFFNRGTIRDMKLTTAAALAIIIFFLVLLFRRFTGVFLPFVIILSSMASTLGLMALCGIKIKITTGMLPAFLVAVSVADAVHILTIFYRRFNITHDKEDAITFAMGHSGLAIIMTSLTTAAGLLSFSFAELTAIGEMGTFAAAGVILALVYTITLLPPLISILPIRHKPRVTRQSVVMDRVLLAFADFSDNHSVKIVAASLVLTVIAVIGLFQLRYSDNIVNFFPEKTHIKRDLKLLDRELNGTVNMEVVLDTGREDGIHEPEFLKQMDVLIARLQDLKDDDLYIGNITSINDIVKEIHQAFHNNNPDYYALPDTRALISQEFLLFENSGADDLERIVDSQFRKTRLTIKTPWVDSVVYDRFSRQVAEECKLVFQDTAEVTVTGMAAIMGRTIPATMRSMVKSYVIAFIAISLMMIFLVGDLKVGMLSMFPNLLPIFLLMGFTGYARLPLDMTSLLIGSIAIGLVVDDTMHFIYNFQKYFQRTGNPLAAVRETMTGAGRALLITSLTLAGSFYATLFSLLLNNIRFGLLTGSTILLALLADFVLAPALMILVSRGKARTNAEPAPEHEIMAPAPVIDN
jgi:predicted RND superfamily exporter protein